MSATNEAYANPAWGSRPAGGPAWGPPPWGGQGWHDRPHWARDIPRPAWIAFMVLGFVFWWPVGLAMLVYLLSTGRLGCGRRRDWSPPPAGYAPASNAGAPWSAWCWPRWGADSAPPSSGNRAFDEYRSETLRRMEEEQREFGAFLERLRAAKDRSEFEQFMTERRARPPQPSGTAEPQT